MLTKHQYLSMCEALNIDPYDTTAQYKEVYKACCIPCPVDFSTDYIYGSEGFKEILSNIWEKIKKFFKQVFEGIKTLYEKFKRFISAIIARIKAFFTQKLSAVSESKDTLKDLIDKLIKALKEIEINHYIEDDNTLKDINDSYDSISKVVKSSVENIFGDSGYAVLDEVGKSFAEHDESLSYIKSKASNCPIFKHEDIVAYIKGDSSKYGKTTDIYGVVSNIVPEMFDPAKLSSDTIKETYNVIIKKLQTKADFLTGILNSITNKSHNDSQDFNNILTKMKFSFKESDTEEDRNLKINEYPKAVASMVVYIKRIVLIIQYSTQIFARCFNTAIGEFSHQFKKEGIQNTHIKFNKENTNKALKGLSPLMTLEGINIYKLGDFIENLEKLGMPTNGLEGTNQTINAFCASLSDDGEDPVIFVTNVMLENVRDKNLLKYLCYHELGHYMNGDTLQDLRIKTLHIVLNYLTTEKSTKKNNILARMVSGDQRNLRQEIRADIYVIERHIFTTEDVKKYMNQLVNIITKVTGMSR